MLLALALGPGTSWLNHQDARWAQAISAALGTGWAWAVAAVLAGWIVTSRSGLGRLRWAAVAGAGVLVLAVLGYYASDYAYDRSSSSVSSQQLPPGMPIPDPLATAWADARFWLMGALLTGPALGVLGALTRRNGRTALLAALAVPLLPIAELTMLVHTAAPQTAQDRFGLRVRIVTLALALVWLITVPIVQRAREAKSPRHP